MSADPTRVSFDLSRTVTAIASMLGIAPKRVRGAVDLLSDGCTIPFIARYRKESTGGLNEVQIGAVEDALAAATELIDRKNRVLKSIFQQGVRDRELEHAIVGAHDAREVDDLYLPYKGTRKTRATVARERGLDPLASILVDQVDLDTTRASILKAFVDPASRSGRRGSRTERCRRYHRRALVGGSCDARLVARSTRPGRRQDEEEARL